MVTSAGISALTVASIAAFIAILSLIIQLSGIGFQQSKEQRKDALKVLGQQGSYYFTTLDVDEDGQLSPEEFGAILEKLTGQIPHSDIHKGSDKNEYITLKTSFKPLIMETMKAYQDDITGGFATDPLIITGLKEWKTVQNETAVFDTFKFDALLPKTRVPRVSKVWHIYRADKDTYSSNRYYAPIPVGDQYFITEMLKMFHPNAFTVMRFAPQGAVGVVRAQNDKYLDITFRIHAEFQINEPPAWPFWFTPAYFTGNLIISKDYSHIEYFHMYVPAKKNLNVDMEWLSGPSEHEGMQVEIGYMPQMELESMAPSTENKDSDTPDSIQAPPQLRWTEEISQKEADRDMEKALYPFKQVEYLEFPEALSRAKAENKLMHSIIMWGALDDQSC